MATNTQGYPYPLGTEPVAQGDNAIKALADAVGLKLGTRLAAGTANVVFSAAATANVGVTFPVGAFTVAPRVMVSVAAGTMKLYAIVAGPTTAAGTTLSGISKDSTVITQTTALEWLAWQV